MQRAKTNHRAKRSCSPSCVGPGKLAPEKPYSFRSMLSQWELTEPFYRWVKENHPKISGGRDLAE